MHSPASTEIPYTVSPRRDTGLFNAKIGIWLFLASEVMLFGGLFSAYVFLRAGVREGVDIPWPSGVEVHGNFIWIGFTNTLVLIVSSVFVVMAWMQLKLRHYGAYQLYMAGVIACAAIFMVFKTIEYNSKLNHHFGVRLVDGTLLDGKLGYDKIHHCPGDVITFAARGADFSLRPVGLSRSPDPYFLRFAQADVKSVKLQILEPKENAREVQGVSSDLVQVSTLQFVPAAGSLREVAVDRVADVLRSEMNRYRKTAEQHDAKTRASLKEAAGKAADEKVRLALRRELDTLLPTPIPSQISGTWEKPATFQFRRGDVLNGKWSATSVPFFRGNYLKGDVVDDSLDLVVHDIDLQMARDVEKSLAWTYLGEGYHKGFDHFQRRVLERYRDWTAKGRVIPKDHLLRWSGAHPAEIARESGGSGEARGEGAHGGVQVSIPGKDVRFASNHGPKFGTYYAIYYTLTGLHGLHVIGGAIVLGYFLCFGKRIYQRNPEHLANRVEVGGLFWHFVDIVWIFLFPIMYLL